MARAATRLIGVTLLALLAAAAWLARPSLVRLAPTPLLPMPAHEQYAAALALAGVAATDAGRAWTAAAERALEQPRDAVPTATQRAVSDDTSAVAWRVEVRRGQRVTIATGAAPDLFFLDLFTAGERRRVASAAPREASLEHIADDDGELIARLQSRLDTPSGISYEVTQRVGASLLFPVEGRDRRAVQSVFGDGRDAGRRRHEGIDIFAPRGTPALAAVDGWVTRQTTNRLGGNVVWVWSPSRRLSLYYAHLDRQAVAPGDRVRAGDVIGYVGNTGNARATAPHLHFGVYASLAGAVDPLPFVVDPASPHRPRQVLRGSR